MYKGASPTLTSQTEAEKWPHSQHFDTVTGAGVAADNHDGGGGTRRR